jgi:hypothetical protein
MQYILSEEEMAEHKKVVSELKRLQGQLPTLSKLQEFATMVANKLPVESGWYKGKVWGCILTKPKNDEWYCDDCPAREICPHPYKAWSK